MSAEGEIGARGSASLDHTYACLHFRGPPCVTCCFLGYRESSERLLPKKAFKDGMVGDRWPF